MVSDKPLSLLCLEDEPIIARRLRRLCDEILGDRLVTFDHVPTVAEAKDRLGRTRYDILLLDLNLGDGDGFEVLDWFNSFGGRTIVVSAYAERAIEGFDHGIADFVPKPIAKNRLKRALERVERQNASPNKAMQQISFRNGRRITIRPVSELRYLKGADKYTECCFQDGGELLHDKSLTEFESLLPRSFFRSHKSYMVNLKQVVALESAPGGKYEIELKSGERLPVGRTRVAQLRTALSAGKAP